MSAGISAKSWRRRVGLPLAMVGLASAWLMVGSPSVAATGGFVAADGNLTSSSTEFDWNSFSTTTWAVPSPPPVTTLRETSKVVSGWSFKGFEDTVVSNADTGFAGGVKQDHDCAARKGSKAPNKDDLARTYLATKTVGNDVFLTLAWTRIPQNSVTASAHVGYEFNKGSTACSVGSDQVKRTGGDMLVVYDFAGGSSAPLIKLSRWLTDAWVDEQGTAIESLCEVNNSTVAGGCWGNTRELTAGGFAEGKVWPGPGATTDAIKPPNATDPGPVEFGEAGINLTAAGVFRAGVCEGFGRTYAVSRSSGNSTQAAMMDIVGPGAFTVTNCGSVSFYKQDDLGGALQGAVFTLFTDSAKTAAYSKGATLASASGAGDTTLTVSDASGFPSAGAFQVSVDGGPALTVSSRSSNVLSLAAAAPAGYSAGVSVVWNGKCSPSGTPATCSLVGLPFGTYTLSETTVPGGYTPASDKVFTISQADPAGAQSSMPHTFIDNRSPITITVRKGDDASPVVPLEGATFGLFEDNGTVASGSGASITGFSPVVLPASPTTTGLAGALAADATSLQVSSAVGHPAAPYWIRLGTGMAAEDVKVTARTGTTLTVLRSQQLTTAAAWPDLTDVSLLTGTDPLVKRCQTSALPEVLGTCQLSTVYPGNFVLDETVVPTGYAKPSTLPAPVVVAVGDTDRSLPSASGYYEDPRLFKVITLVCKAADSSLYRSNVTYSGTGLSSAQTAVKKSLPSGASLPDGVSQEELCGLGGATLSDVQKGTYGSSTVIGVGPAAP